MDEYDIKWDTEPDCFKKPRSTVEFKWKIENFSLLPREVDTFYESPHFSSAGFKWCLILLPNGETRHKSQGWIGLYLKMVKRAKDTSILTDFVVGIDNIHGTKEFLRGFSNQTWLSNDIRGWKNFLDRAELDEQKDEIFPSDTLTISIWLQYETPEYLMDTTTEQIGSISIGGPWKKNLELQGLAMLSSSFKKIFLDDQDYDITINVKGEIFKAHKVILRARSEVLSSMLIRDMAEKSSNVINIHDCEPEAFKIFLLYLYSGKAENLSETNMFDVYCIADKYNIPDLKAECILYIKCSMSFKTICGIICLAREHNDSELLACATDYFIINVKEILPTEEWKLFRKKYPKYGNELYKRAIHTPNVVSYDIYRSLQLL